MSTIDELDVKNVPKTILISLCWKLFKSMLHTACKYCLLGSTSKACLIGDHTSFYRGFCTFSKAAKRILSDLSLKSAARSPVTTPEDVLWVLPVITPSTYCSRLTGTTWIQILPFYLSSGTLADYIRLLFSFQTDWSLDVCKVSLHYWSLFQQVVRYWFVLSFSTFHCHENVEVQIRLAVWVDIQETSQTIHVSLHCFNVHTARKKALGNTFLTCRD